MQAIREFRCWRGFEFVANAGQREINAESFVTGEHDADVNRVSVLNPEQH